MNCAVYPCKQRLGIVVVPGGAEGSATSVVHRIHDLFGPKLKLEVINGSPTAACPAFDMGHAGRRTGMR